MWFPVIIGALLAYYNVRVVDAFALLVVLTFLQGVMDILFARSWGQNAISDYEFYSLYLKSGIGWDRYPWLRYLAETVLIFSAIGLTIFIIGTRLGLLVEMVRTHGGF